MAEEKKEEKPEKKREEYPEGIVHIDLGLSGLLKGLGLEKIFDLATELERKGVATIERTGEIGGGLAMFSARVRRGPRGRPLIEGTVKPKVAVPRVEAPAVVEREPLVDVFEKEDYITVTAELPGVDENDIKTEAKETTLKISAETKDRKYSKAVELPAVVTGELESTYKNGVLEVKLKKAE